MSLENPFSVLFNDEGTALAVTSSQSASLTAGTQPGLLVMGSSSLGAQFLKLDSQGALWITGSVTDTIDITGALAITGAVGQGNAGSIGQSWFMTLTDGTQTIGGAQATPLWVSGVVDILNPIDAVVSGLTFDSNNNLLTALSGVTVAGGAITVTGSLTTTETKHPNTVVTGFGSSTANVTVLAANTLRGGATLFMDGNAKAYVKLGAGASNTSFTVLLRNNSFFEVPNSYTGQIDVTFNKNQAAQVLHVTEINE